LQTKHDIQALLAGIGRRPVHRFGQNFMIDGNLLRLLLAAGEIKPHDLVIEVGPGTGSLTEEILTTGCRLVAVEIDRELSALLRQRLGHRPNFTLIEGDALNGKHAINPQLLAAISGVKGVKLVANLPYQIASPLLIDLLIAGVELLAFTVQKEVAQRLAASAGSDDYGPLSVIAQLLAKVELLRTLPPQAFWPMPKIQSSLVCLTRADQLGEDAARFSRFLHAVFAYRRKTLGRALREAGYAEIDFDLKIRAEELSPAEWLHLYRKVQPLTPGLGPDRQ
jgi:16S rRNA (adenine1518-N6/adenine1519-N6)-dimethyltransferase